MKKIASFLAALCVAIAGITLLAGAGIIASATEGKAAPVETPMQMCERVASTYRPWYAPPMINQMGKPYLNMSNNDGFGGTWRITCTWSSNPSSKPSSFLKGEASRGPNAVFVNGYVQTTEESLKRVIAHEIAHVVSYPWSDAKKAQFVEMAKTEARRVQVSNGVIQYMPIKSYDPQITQWTGGSYRGSGIEIAAESMAECTVGKARNPSNYVIPNCAKVWDFFGYPPGVQFVPGAPREPIARR